MLADLIYELKFSLSMRKRFAILVGIVLAFPLTIIFYKPLGPNAGAFTLFLLAVALVCTFIVIVFLESFQKNSGGILRPKRSEMHAMLPISRTQQAVLKGVVPLLITSLFFLYSVLAIANNHKAHYAFLGLILLSPLSTIVSDISSSLSQRLSPISSALGTVGFLLCLVVLTKYKEELASSELKYFAGALLVGSAIFTASFFSYNFRRQI